MFIMLYLFIRKNEGKERESLKKFLVLGISSLSYKILLMEPNREQTGANIYSKQHKTMAKYLKEYTYRWDALCNKKLFKWHPNQLPINQEIKRFRFPIRVSWSWSSIKVISVTNNKKLISIKPQIYKLLRVIHIRSKCNLFRAETPKLSFSLITMKPEKEKCRNENIETWQNFFNCLNKPTIKFSRNQTR